MSEQGKVVVKARLTENWMEEHEIPNATDWLADADGILNVYAGETVLATFAPENWVWIERVGVDDDE